MERVLVLGILILITQQHDHYHTTIEEIKESVGTQCI